MTVTFLVELNLDDISDLANVAFDIEDQISDIYDVISVKPWARPSSNPLASLPTLTETPQIQPPNQ